MRLTLAAAALVIGGVSCPAAHADATYGDGSYTVPGQIPYGTYTAQADPRFNPSAPAACTYSMWTSAGKVIASDSGPATQTRTAVIQPPAVALFITHGCTPWTKAQ
jgi:hypothetical protein